MHLGLDMELWYPPGLPASNCSPSIASFSKPETVGRLKYFIGAYKVLLALLDTVVVGRLYYERIN